MINIFGSKDFRDIKSRTVAQVGQREILSVLQAFAAALNSGLQLTLSTLCDFTTEVQSNFGFNPGGEMQVITEYSHPEATTRTGEWPVAFGIKAFGYRNLFTQAYLDEADLERLNRDTLDAAIADVTTVRRTALKAILGDLDQGAALASVANYTHNDNLWPGQMFGNLTVRRLFNNDGSTGELYVGGTSVSIGTLQAYKVSGNATVDATAMQIARDYLVSVGHDADIVFVVSKTTGDTLSGLAGFEKINDAKIVDPNKRYALVTSPQGIGRYKTWGDVEVWPQFPDGYVFAYDRSKPKPVVLREHHLEKNRGFGLFVPENAQIDPMQPLKNKVWRRIIGSGVRNRANGVVVQLTASANYAAPAL